MIFHTSPSTVGSHQSIDGLKNAHVDDYGVGVTLVMLLCKSLGFQFVQHISENLERLQKQEKHTH